MKQMICSRCGTLGAPKKHTPGSFIIELFAWMLLLLPGLIYSLWRVSSRKLVCRSCGSIDLVDPASPVGRELVERFAQHQRTT